MHSSLPPEEVPPRLRSSFGKRRRIAYGIGMKFENQSSTRSFTVAANTPLSKTKSPHMKRPFHGPRDIAMNRGGTVYSGPFDVDDDVN